MRNVNNHWPPEPKVAGSNLAWRAKNPRKAPSQPRTNEHENARTCGAIHTDKRQGITVAQEPLPGHRPRQPHCYHTPAGDVWSWTWIAVAIALALALVALTGCDRDCRGGIVTPPFAGIEYARCFDPRARLELLPSGAAVRCVCPGGCEVIHLTHELAADWNASELLKGGAA
jgi:hypothetical protein